MYCRNCGSLLIDGTNFCPYCGTKVENIVNEVKVNDDVSTESLNEEVKIEDKQVENEVPKKYRVFGTLALIFSIVSIFMNVTIVYGIFGFALSVVALVFSIICKVKAHLGGKVTASLILSIISTTLGLFAIIFIIYLFLNSEIEVSNPFSNVPDSNSSNTSLFKVLF